jgi:hypothetical protein
VELQCAWGRASYAGFIVLGVLLVAWGLRQKSKLWPWWAWLFVSYPDPGSGALAVGIILSVVGVVGLVGLLFAQCR